MEVLPSRVQTIDFRGKGHQSQGTGDLPHTIRSPTKKHTGTFERNQMSDTTTTKMSQQKFMAVYKVNECKKKFNHDKRQCLNWHSQADRRRNPFHVGYTTVEVRRSQIYADIFNSIIVFYSYIPNYFFSLSVCHSMDLV